MTSNLEQSIYYIISTPVVDGSNVYSYNIVNGSAAINSFKYDGLNKIYYSEVVSNLPQSSTGCPQFDTTEIFDSTTIGGIEKNIISNYGFPSGYLLSQKMTIFDLSTYISNLLNNFIADLKIVNKCNIYLTTNSNTNSNCNDTFQGYANGSQVNTSQLPLYQYSAMNKTNRAKHLHQQSNDLNNLLTTYKNIIQTIPKTENKYENITQQYQQIISLRNDLDMKLNEIYKTTDSKYVHSQYNLNQTVYTNVLLTILATSMIYIVLTKM
jgi:hypothetical protein